MACARWNQRRISHGNGGGLRDARVRSIAGTQGGLASPANQPGTTGSSESSTCNVAVPAEDVEPLAARLEAHVAPHGRGRARDEAGEVGPDRRVGLVGVDVVEAACSARPGRSGPPNPIRVGILGLEFGTPCVAGRALRMRGGFQQILPGLKLIETEPVETSRNEWPTTAASHPC